MTDLLPPRSHMVTFGHFTLHLQFVVSFRHDHDLQCCFARNWSLFLFFWGGERKKPPGTMGWLNDCCKKGGKIGHGHLVIHLTTKALHFGSKSQRQGRKKIILGSHLAEKYPGFQAEHEPRFCSYWYKIKQVPF